MDDSIGKILNYLDESGLRDQTMVFFTSDNGLVHLSYHLKCGNNYLKSMKLLKLIANDPNLPLFHVKPIDTLRPW